MNWHGKAAFLRLFGSTILSQAVLSAASLLVSFLLIRRQTPVQYGYYVLANVTLLLLASLQSAFVLPTLVVRIAGADATARRQFVGGLLGAQRRIVRPLAAALAVLVVLAWAAGWLDATRATLGAAVLVAAIATLAREYFRCVLLAYHRNLDVLRADGVYVVLLVAGAYASTFSPFPAATAVLTMGLAALVGSVLLARDTWRNEPWETAEAAAVIVREIAPTGAWSVSGAAVHWAFAQGYTYLVAAMLDVESVAALAATRLLLMPINLLSTGIGQTMLPTASRWLNQVGAQRLYRRLLWLCAGLCAVALLYFGVLWLVRDWIFRVLLHRDFAGRDELLSWWVLVFLATALRDQLGFLLVVRGRLRELSTLTFASAAVALVASYLALLRMGTPGALVGILIGEVLNTLGIHLLTRRESRRSVAQAKTA